MLENKVADGIHQMGLSQPHTAINKEGIIGPSRGLSYSKSSGMGKAIAVADDKCLKSIFWIELGRYNFIPRGEGVEGATVFRSPRQK